MMKKICIVLFIVTSCVSAQRGLKNLPKITISDFNIESRAIDSIADAQIIEDIGFTYFIEKDNYLQHVLEKTTRIQILNKQGKDEGVIKIPFYVGGRIDEEVVSFKATCYNLINNKIEKQTVNKKVLLENDINEWWKEKKYAFPNVKEGTIIEYSYEITSTRNFNLRKWYFQHKIPTKKSKYKLELCPYYNYIMLKNGEFKYDKDTTYIRRENFYFNYLDHDTKTYEWEASNIPAFKNDKYVTCEDDYLLNIEFQLESYRGVRGGKYDLMQTWEKLTEELLDKSNGFGHFLKSKKKTNLEVVNSLNLESKSTSEKIQIIYDYVRNNFYWNKYYGIYTDNKKDFLKTKTGNVAAINLYLCSLLNSAGIQANPLLSSTRSHGKVFYKYPFLDHFNYVTVFVKNGNEKYILDATETLLPMGLLPKRSINGYGLIVQNLAEEKKAEFLPMVPIKKNITEVTFFTNIDVEKGLINTFVKAQYDGYNAFNYRDLLKDKGEVAVENKINKEWGANVEEMVVKNYNNLKKPLSFTFKVNEEIDRLGDKIIFTPFDKNDYASNNLKDNNRNYPVDYGCSNDDSFRSVLKIPQGYTIEYLPKSNSLIDGELKLSFNYVVEQNINVVSIKVDILRKKLIYESKEYDTLKKFYDSVEKMMNESIILKKVQ